MANALFDPGREGFLAGEIDWDTAVIKAAVVRGYTFNPAHRFVSEVTGAGGTLVATLAAGFASKTVTNGVADAADITFPAVGAGAAITSLIVFQASAVTGGADVGAAAQRLIYFADGRVRFEAAATAAGAATTLLTEDLPAAIASGATLTLISGTGPATITTSAVAVAGDRSIAVSALASGVTAGAVYEYTPSITTLPVTPNGGDISFQWDNGANRIFRL